MMKSKPTSTALCIALLVVTGTGSAAQDTSGTDTAAASSAVSDVDPTLPSPTMHPAATTATLTISDDTPPSAVDHRLRCYQRGRLVLDVPTTRIDVNGSPALYITSHGQNDVTTYVVGSDHTLCWAATPDGPTPGVTHRSRH